MIFFTPVILKYMKKNPRYNGKLVTANKLCQSLSPSLYRGSTVVSRLGINESLLV